MDIFPYVFNYFTVFILRETLLLEFIENGSVVLLGQVRFYEWLMPIIFLHCLALVAGFTTKHLLHQ